MSQETNSMDALKGAFLAPKTENLLVKAEDIPLDGGMDFSKTYFDPQVGHTYTLKFIANLGGDSIVHRKVYKKIPDPTRKGKTFQVVSSGSAKTCQVLELFFDLNNLKKAGDPLAVQKIDKFLTVTNQGATIVEILNSPIKEDIGKFLIFVFSTFGPNATVANLINAKLNPSPEKIAEGFEKEDIFDLFESPVMILQCVEASYDGVKGRDFTKSEWSPKKRGAFVKLEGEDGKVQEHVFSKADIVDGDFKPEVLPFFKKLVETLQAPEISIHNMFAYKDIDDERNTEETVKYLTEVDKKVKEIVPIIRDAKSIAEVIGHGNASGDESNDSAKTIGGQSAADILKQSAPSELVGSILNDGKQETVKEVETTPQSEKTSDEVNNILNS